MRDFKWLFIFLSWCIVAATACNNEDTPLPPDDTPTAQSFELEVVAVTKTTMEFSVVPADVEAEYFVTVVDRATADDFTKDEYLVATIYQDITDEAAQVGKTLAEYMPEIVDRGAVEGSFSGLAPDTEYYLICFGVDAAQEYAAVGEVAKELFVTESAPHYDSGFTVTTEVVNNRVTFSVVPDDKAMSWHLFSVTKALYDEYTSAEGEVGWSKEYFFSMYFQDEINNLLGQGMSQEEVIAALIFSGELELEARGLSVNTEYVYLIAGLSLDSDGLFITTDATVGEFTTGEAAKSDMSFDIEVWDIEAMSACFSITPSKNNEKYCALVAPWDGVTDADAMMHRIVDQWGGLMSLMANDMGPVEHSGDKKFKLPAADTEYYIIAFGYDGGITTEAAMKTFRTLPGGSHDDVKFEVTTSSPSPYGFNMSIKSSDPTIYYIVGVCDAAEYDETEFVALENEIFDYYYTGSADFNPSITHAEVLDQYYYNGDSSIAVSGLQPETELMAYIYTLDNATGHVVKCFTFDAIATTTPLGDVTPTIELVGYYSGDEEAGTIFGEPAATKGKAITVVTYHDYEGARSLFTTMVQGDCTNHTAYSDAELWSVAAGYWNKCNVRTPYTFYTAVWEEVQTALAYATDTTGKPGGIGRLYTCATADQKSPIEELRTLYEDVKAADKSVAMPASMVVGAPRSSRPTLTTIDSEAMTAEGVEPIYPSMVARSATIATCASEHISRHIMRDRGER